MTDRTDRIFAVIDAGLQTPVPDPTFGDFHERNTGRCCRCDCSEPVEGSDWCDRCRSYLLGDETDDSCPLMGSRVLNASGYRRFMGMADALGRLDPPLPERFGDQLAAINARWFALERGSALCRLIEPGILSPSRIGSWTEGQQAIDETIAVLFDVPDDGRHSCDRPFA